VALLRANALGALQPLVQFGHRQRLGLGGSDALVQQFELALHITS
jgi:hypothetical protein